MTVTFKFEVNWTGSAWVDESANLQGFKSAVGFAGEATYEPVASVGTLCAVLDNRNARYSPDNAASPLTGLVLPRRKVRMMVNSNSVWYPLFYGTLERIEPDAGPEGERRVTFTCADAFILLEGSRYATTLQQDKRADELIAGIVAATFTPTATTYDPGTERFPLAADGWSSDQTTAREAIRVAALSEYGRFYLAPDGSARFTNRLRLMKQAAAALTFNAAPFTLDARRDMDGLVNDVQVIVYPRAINSAETVIAGTTSILTLPPKLSSGPSIRRVRLRFRDPQTGQPCGGKDLANPLAYTDFTINETRKGDGFDYTATGAATVAINSIKAGEVVLEFANYAIGPLYVTRLQVRGKAVTTYDPIAAQATDAASITAYQTHVQAVDLPLSGDLTFAESLARYLLDRGKAPITQVRSLDIADQDVVAGVSLFGLNLLDTVRVTDAQTALSAALVQIVRIECSADANGFRLRFGLFRADDQIYWIMNSGALDSSTRLGV